MSPYPTVAKARLKYTFSRRVLFRSIWWTIITFATVGYGDIYPITFLGELLGCIICLVGVTMVAIPIGIISTSFINIVQKKKQNQEKENDSQ